MSRNKVLGFSILSFEKPDDHFIQLLELISSFPNVKISIHHDTLRAGAFPSQLIKNFDLLMVEPTYKTYWSHINNVLATIDTFELLYSQKQTVDWFITITPTCYPIKKTKEIQAFYNSCTSDALIDMHPIGRCANFKEIDKYQIRDFKSQPWFKLPFFSKSLKFYWRTIRKKMNVPSHPFLDDNQPWQGSNWMSINRKVVERLIVQQIKSDPLISFYKNYIKAAPNMHPCPQETVLQTFIANQNDLNIELNNYRYINWEGSKNWSPNILTIKNYEAIKECQAHWARKFDNSLSIGLKEEIDRNLLKYSKKKYATKKDINNHSNI